MNLRASPQLGPWSSGQLGCAVFVVKIQDGTGLYRVSWINLCTTGFLSVFKPDVSSTNQYPPTIINLWDIVFISQVKNFVIFVTIQDCILGIRNNHISTESDYGY